MKNQPAGEGRCVEKPAAIISGQSQAEGIAKFASRVTYDDLTPERRERLKISILDSLACAISVIGASPITACLAQAREFGVGSYVALLSEADHFNSKGQRLTSAAAIIRQDRANFHRYGIKDPQDEGGTFFADEGNRAALEQMIERGRADPGVLSRIVNGTPLIRVDIYRGADGPFVRVALLN
jgi:hypothetical protein